MDYRAIVSLIVLISLVNFTTGVYEEAQYKEPEYQKPPSRILSHRQSQNHDGGFKFAFSAENGLAQSEVIAPDGSRNGGYSYVDPHGKTITVKYTAGKEGFKIVQGEHIPKENPPQPQQIEQPETRVPHYAQQPAYKPQYIPSKPQYLQPKPQYLQPKPQYPNSHPVYQPRFEPQQPRYLGPEHRQVESEPRYQQPQPRYTQEASASNSVEENKEPEYNDAPGKPYSFGVGYAFQFSS